MWTWKLLLVNFPYAISLSVNHLPSASGRGSALQTSLSPYWNECLYFELERCWASSASIGNSETASLINSIPLSLQESGDDSNVGFASKSQIKRACRNGALWILLEKSINSCLDWSQKVPHPPSEENFGSSPHSIHLSYAELMQSPLLQAHPSAILQPGDQVWIMVDRHWSDANWNGYPVSITKDWLPPQRAYQRVVDRKNVVVYQDDEIAVIDKPGNLTTISKNDDDEEDLQSLLPFLLQYPRKAKYLPRPVHRLDKQTSGLVLVAKSSRAMKHLSQAFSKRRVTKTYSAIVLSSSSLQGDDGPNNTNTTIHSSQRPPLESPSSSWQTIDHPISGKPAISSWRLVANPDPSIMCLSLLEVRPHTGRTHQIRRHLAYNLQSPIVGDCKYYYTTSRRDDKEWHENQDRMYLHCHKLEFPYYETDKAIASSTIATFKSHATVSIVQDSSLEEEKEKDPSATTTRAGRRGMRMKISIPLPTCFFDRLRLFDDHV